MARINDILDKLNDNAHTTVDLPGDGDECFRSNALLIKKENPYLELLFPPDAWNARDLKLGSDCTLIVDHNGRPINLVARLDSVVNDRRLSFTAREPLSPESLRDYFRVSISIPIEASYVAGLKEINARSWKLSGTTLDMSGSGALCSFSEPLEKDTQARIELTLPTREMEVITAFGHVVRCRKIKEHLYHIALHFDAIDSESQDKIMACCFELQRRYLRMRVRLEGVTNAA